MAAPTVFKVGEAAPANTFLAIWMARAAGLFAANGLAVEVVPMVGGREAGPALTAGKIHLMHIGMSSVVRANAAGADLRVIGSLSNVIRHAMFTAPHVKTAADLKGGTVGISSTGSESDPTTTLALQRLGLVRADVTVREIGRKRLDAVRSGEVDATMLGEPYRSQAIAAGMTPIVDLLAERIPWLYSGLVVDRNYLAENRDTVTRFMKATIEGNYLAVTDAARAKEVLAKELAIADPAILEITYDNFREATPRNAEASLEGAANIIEIVARPGASREICDYVDTSVLEDLRADGFLDAMAEKYPAA